MKRGWGQRKDDPIVLKRLDNRIETCVCLKSGSWKIVLRTGVCEQLSLMMALFTHSLYAAEETNLITSNAAMERQQNPFSP